MIRGFSDAQIQVVKTGPWCQAQGLLCHDLGPDVCPRVSEVTENGYTMEMLHDPPRRLHREWMKNYKILSDFVWCRTPFEDPFNWLAPLYLWADTDYPALRLAISKVFGDREPSGGYARIHGDPTLANTMCRSNGAQVITDPMGRYLYRYEIPERVAVDVGKLLQSAAGWEFVLGMPNAFVPFSDDIKWAVDLLPIDIRRESVLWGAIHIARVKKRAAARNMHSIEDWADKMVSAMGTWIVTGQV